jgi:hypothetical protein
VTGGPAHSTYRPILRTATLAYFYRCVERLIEEKRPTLIVIDEAWKLLDDYCFAKKFAEWLRTARLKNVVVEGAETGPVEIPAGDNRACAMCGGRQVAASPIPSTDNPLRLFGLWRASPRQSGSCPMPSRRDRKQEVFSMQNIGTKITNCTLAWSGRWIVQYRSNAARMGGSPRRPNQIRTLELIFVNASRAQCMLWHSMLRVLRHLIALVAVLAQTLVGTAAMSAAYSGAGPTAMVICGESGAETVWLDASGTPTPAPHDCLSCLVCSAFDTVHGADGAQALIWSGLGTAAEGPAFANPVPHSRPWLAARPRGPPSDKSLNAILLRRLEFGQIRPGQSVSLRGQPKKDART